jgi:hypothetical protein
MKKEAIMTDALTKTVEKAAHLHIMAQRGEV